MSPEDMEEITSIFKSFVTKLNEANEANYKYRGSIKVSAKGEAQIDVSVKSDDFDEITAKTQILFEGMQKICRDNSLPLAGEGKK